ncbi:DUF3618 domain-containing protein [Streptomyces sp. SID1046]|uniref:DUF3618 domain-containing protein n=1 Tax=Streptomyces sp. SID1046 TaxID=2690249 RepID=UPI001371E06F|nr:DUF3618 domain-containing protein [Streptomyces sp. SID1046]MYV78456.1 DUF3618 domain-containing protein [Streptomyces sp. SID1046]
MNDDARTNIGTPAPTPAGPGSAELRDQVERTRDELGRTVEALAAKADIKAQAKEKAALVTEQIREKTGHAARLVKDKTPDPLLEKAAQAAEQMEETAVKAARYATDQTPDPLLEKAGQAAAAARANRTPLLVVGAAVVVFLLVRRGRGHRR